LNNERRITPLRSDARVDYVFDYNQQILRSICQEPKRLFPLFSY
jgi:hypothetical protein